MLKNDVLKVIKTVGKGVLSIACMGVVAGMALGDNYKHYCNATYSDAVEAIMESDMWSSDCHKAVSALKLNADTELYKAVIRIANSSMWSSDKLKSILSLCEEEA